MEQMNGHNIKRVQNDILKVSNEAFQEVRISVPWGHIAGKWWGSLEQQPILAIHGWQDNAGTFDALAPYIVEANMSILCIDLPGHGYSSPYPTGMYYYIFLDGIQIVKRIVQHYNWDKIQLMGHSLGGIISFLYASAYPDEVAAFVSLDIASPAVRDHMSLLDKIGATINNFLKYENLSKDSHPSYTYEDMVQVAVDGYKGSCTRESVEILLRRGMKMIGGGKYIFTRDVRLKAIGLGMIGIDESMAMARLIKCRVMNIRAIPGFIFEKPEYYDMILDEIEKSAAVMERHVVSGMHHFHLNNASDIAPLVVNFFASKSNSK